MHTQREERMEMEIAIALHSFHDKNSTPMDKII